MGPDRVHEVKCRKVVLLRLCECRLYVLLSVVIVLRRYRGRSSYYKELTFYGQKIGHSFHFSFVNRYTGRERLIRTRLIRSSTNSK